MNYIITGGTGFIGTHLTNLIKERYPNAQVYNLDIVKPGTPNPVVKDYKPAVREGETLQSTYIECDVRKPIPDNLPFTPTPDDIIFNFAAVHRTPGHEDIEYFETNIRGAENVCAFAEKWGIRRIVFTSSIAPYGAAEEQKKETTLPTPNTAYGISKLVAEKIHMAWQNGDANRHLLIVRPGVVFGKGENGNFTRLYWAIRGHKFAYPGRKDTIKACIYVKELVRFMLWSLSTKSDGSDSEVDGRRGSQMQKGDNLLASRNATTNGDDSPLYRRGVRGEALYNCCYSPAYTIEHIVEAMKKTTGLTQFVPYVPNWLIMPMAAVAKLLGSPMGICPARVKKLQISTNICGERLRNSGYQFKWTFEEALADWLSDNDGKCLN